MRAPVKIVRSSSSLRTLKSRISGRADRYRKKSRASCYIRLLGSLSCAFEPQRQVMVSMLGCRKANLSKASLARQPQPTPLSRSAFQGQPMSALYCRGRSARTFPHIIWLSCITGEGQQMIEHCCFRRRAPVSPTMTNPEDSSISN